jgi:uncharacterized membrane protein YbhN (UPF0104 family)
MSMKAVLKVAVAALILGLIALRVEFAAAFELIAQADLFWMGAAVAVSLLIIVSDAAFWSSAMRAVGLSLSFRAALLFGISGWFFINVAPSTVGADLFRAAQMRAAGATTERAIRLVSAARLMSFASLIAVIGAGLPFAFRAFESDSDRIALGVIFTAASAAFAGLVLFGPRLAETSLAKIIKPIRFAGLLASDLRTLLVKTPVSGWLFLTAQHLCRIAGVVFVARAVGVDADIFAFFALVPAAFLAAMAPITIGGWGVREASFVYFLGVAGVDAHAALATSILFGLTRILIGLAGGLVWLAARSDRFKIAIDAPRESEVRTKA